MFLVMMRLRKANGEVKRKGSESGVVVGLKKLMGLRKANGGGGGRTENANGGGGGGTEEG